MTQCCSGQDKADRAWALLLQHPVLSQATTSICKLLCVSTSMQQAIHDNLAGELAVAVCVDSQKSNATASLRQWLCSHGDLVKSVRFSQASALECNRAERLQQASLVAAGIRDAAARCHGGLHITSFTSNVCSKLLLEALPCLAASLHHLELGPFCTDELSKQLSAAPAAAASRSPAALPHTDNQAGLGQTCVSGQGPASTASTAALQPQPQQCSAMLASLTSLTSLVLHGHAANAILPTLQACTQLHCLGLSNLLCSKAHLLQALPAQLRELQVLVDADFTSWQRKQRQPLLSHLTALTRLSCTGEGLFAVQADEVLPHGVVHLVVSDCPKAQPLLALSKLQVLVMQASTMAAEQLQQLPTGLPALREVHLGYDRGNMEAITAAAPGWPALKGLIRALDLRVYPGPLPAQTLAHLAQLGPGLTRLAISGFSVQIDATPATFAAMLAGLPGLKEIKLAYLRLKDEDPPGLPAAGAASLPTAAAAGPTGRQRAAGALGASGGSLRAAVAAAPAGPTDQGGVQSNGLTMLMQQIAALPALTNLSLHSMVLTGPPVAALAAASGLTALQLNECDLCDADVVILADRLSGLRKVGLNWNFAVKSEGLRCLGKLKRLTELHVCCGTTRNEAALQLLQQQLPGLVTVS